MKIIDKAYINKIDEDVRLPVVFSEKEYFLFKKGNEKFFEKEIKLIKKIIKDTNINIDEYGTEYPIYEEEEFILKKKMIK
jgi:hypothetical protein